MKPDEIMDKAIRIAYRNGWGYWNGLSDWNEDEEIKYHFEQVENVDPNAKYDALWYHIIFTQAFTKALWSDFPLSTVHWRY